MAALIAATVATVLLGASPAGADIKHGRDWAFGGSHYKKPVSTPENFNGVRLPLQVIFRGGGDGNINSRTVNNLLESAWEKWGRRYINPRCRRPRYAPFPARAPRRREAWDYPAFYGSNSRFCFAQTHGRFFSDRRHSEQFGHSDAGHFMVANFHREKSDHDFLKENLQQTRRRVLRIAERGYGAHYCVDFNYGMHHMARPSYRGLKYDRVLGRVSFRRKEANRC